MASHLDTRSGPLHEKLTIYQNKNNVCCLFYMDSWQIFLLLLQARDWMCTRYNIRHTTQSWLSQVNKYILYKKSSILYVFSLCFFVGHLIRQKWEWRWCMLAPRTDSRGNWMEFKLSCKQRILVKWALTLLKREHSKLYKSYLIPRSSFTVTFCEQIFYFLFFCVLFFVLIWE